MQTVMDAYTFRGLELKSKTAEEKCGPCPVCGGKDRFVIFVRQNNGHGSWYCRGCDKGGDLIEFYRHCDGMGYREACKAADMTASVQSSCPRHARSQRSCLEATPACVAEKGADQVQDREMWQDKATEFVTRCMAQLTPESGPGRWLAARGLPPESWALYHLGYNAGENGKPCLMRPRKVWGMAEGAPSGKSGKPRTTLWLPRGIVIPRMHASVATRLRIRRNNADLTGEQARMKYYVIPGSDMTPMLLPCRGGVLPPDACALVVEAELDAMAVHHAAGDLTLCLASMTAKLRHLPQRIFDALRRCAVILVAMDYGDENGAGADGWRIWAETFPQARRWPVPQGKDPGEAFALSVDLRAWVTAGLPPALERMATEGKTLRFVSSPAQEETQEEKAARLQDEADRQAERQKFLRTFYPLHRLYFPGDVEAVRLCLEGQGLRLEAAGDDFRLLGHESWPDARRNVLFGFVHRYGNLLNRAAHEEAPCK